MPHLNFNGLDEIWLLKESGNLHWELLESILESWTERGERFYASFFQARIDFQSADQGVYKEGDTLHIETSLARFNSKIYRSTTTFTNGRHTGVVILDSIFVLRDDHNNLVKFEPQKQTDIKQIDNINLNEYQLLKRTLPCHGGRQLDFSPTNFFNGVKLLYCANYLYLSELSEYLAVGAPLGPIKTADLSYFSNINITDAVYGLSNNGETTLHTDGKLLSFARIVR